VQEEEEAAWRGHPRVEIKGLFGDSVAWPADEELC
jgi:hypothetical protein